MDGTGACDVSEGVRIVSHGDDYILYEDGVEFARVADIVDLPSLIRDDPILGKNAKLFSPPVRYFLLFSRR